MKPYISVIVIGYNIENYVENCLNSIFNQTYSNYEIVFIDDGSKDDTLNKVKIFESNPSVRIISKSNGGIVSARKAGVKAAKGEYISFVDGDDWLNPDMLQNLVSCLEKNGAADIVSSNMMRQESNGEFHVHENTVKNKCCDGDEYFRLIMSDRSNHHMFPKLYRTEFVLSAGYLDYPEVTMAEDLMTNSLFGLCSPRVIFSDTANYYYRYNAMSVMRKGDNMLLRQVKTLEYMDAYFEKMKVSEKYKELIDYQWMSYAFTYSHNEIITKRKREIFAAVRNRIGKWKSNKYFQDTLSEYPTHINILFYGYCYLPILTSLLDEILKNAKKMKHYLWEQKETQRDIAYKKRMRAYYQECTNNLATNDVEKYVYLIGTSDRSNIGDHTIAYSEVDFLHKLLPDYTLREITGDHYRYEKEVLYSLIKPFHPIFITGGGFLGDLWMDEEELVRDVISKFSENPIIILPQTLYFSDVNNGEYKKSRVIYSSHKKLLMLARDAKSYRLMLEIMPKENVGFYPDMALLANVDFTAHEKQKSALVCFRKDKECILSEVAKKELENQLIEEGFDVKTSSTLATGNHNGDILLKDRKKEIQEKLEEFNKNKLVVTDRLHGMILATLAGTACIAFDNSSHKVWGVYDQWMQGVKYVKVIHEVGELKAAMDTVLSVKEPKYSPDCLEKQKIALEDRIYNFVNSRR